MVRTGPGIGYPHSRGRIQGPHARAALRRLTGHLSGYLSRRRAVVMNVRDVRDETRRVVVGVDGSPASYEALRWAVRQARLIGATVDAVAAYDLPGAPISR